MDYIKKIFMHTTNLPTQCFTINRLPSAYSEAMVQILLLGRRTSFLPKPQEEALEIKENSWACAMLGGVWEDNNTGLQRCQSHAGCILYASGPIQNAANRILGWNATQCYYTFVWGMQSFDNVCMGQEYTKKSGFFPASYCHKCALYRYNTPAFPPGTPAHR